MAIWVAVLALCGCGQTPEQQNQAAAPTAPHAAPATSATSAPPSAPERPQAPLAEPDRPIDPKSAEAAGQVVQSYGALIEQGRWSEANALWGDASAATQLQKQLAQYAEVHLEIGNPSDPEGAAGSIYVTMPVFFYGDAKDGQPFRRSAEVTLRRVNDVPGSTEAQRRWHIERIDLGA
jgi:hypothetical protein